MWKKYIASNVGKYSEMKEIEALEIDEIFYLSEKYDKRLYNRIYQLTKRTGKEYAYEKIVNGILIKRIG